MTNVKVAPIISDFSGKIIWKSFAEIKRLEEKNERVSDLKKELDKYLRKEDYKNLSLKILDFLKEILVTTGKNYRRKEELWDELYWFRYSFVDKEEESFLLDEVSPIFFEFQSNTKYGELIKKIDSAKKKLSTTPNFLKP